MKASPFFHYLKKILKPLNVFSNKSLEKNIIRISLIYKNFLKICYDVKIKMIKIFKYKFLKEIKNDKYTNN